MKRVALLAVGGLLAASAAFAQAPAPPAGPEPGRDPRPRPEFGRAEQEALVDARVAALQAGLKLTSDQQRYWPAVEGAIRELGAARIAQAERLRQAREAGAARGERRDAERSEANRPDFLERLERSAQAVDERAERLKTLAAAMRPLWTSLDERQKRLVPVLIRPVGDADERGGREERRGHHGRHGHGPDARPR